MKEYWEIIRELREDKDWLQKQVASELGIKRQQYARYETGETAMPIKYLVKLSELYGVSTDYILQRPKGLQWPR